MRERSDSSVRVLVVEDHPVTRDGIRAGLKHDGQVVAEAAGAEEACRLAAQVLPDVVLVDLRLAPGTGQGIDVIKYLREHRPDTRILVLSQADPDELLDAVRAGAHGCVSKSATSAELVAAVHAVRSGPVLPAELAARLIGELHREPRHQSLTAREREVLRCLAKGYDNREIADELGVAVRTINRHLENIRIKLGHHRRSELIRLARDRYQP